jgi:hypothetical protein
MRRSILAAAIALAAWSQSAYIKDDKLVADVESRVRANQPTRAEKRFDEIGWATTLVQAADVAKKTGRPLFVFFHNGNIDTGRC